ncbi:puratrophin-1-like isoform X3 [Diabrotica undecimpunctata]|uniref:puratrophin-1-like isoform X3 n=1 Tax=Diabrotica undecimpunctata TaxID=50387 RepID=UPI003B63EF09
MMKRSRKVTPTATRAVTYDEESWKPSPDESSKDEKDSVRSSEIRQSKTKRVKNYLKKCKNVLGSSKSASLDVSSVCSESAGSSSWYLEDTNIEIKEPQINELEDVFENAQISLNFNDGTSSYQVANIVEVRGPPQLEPLKAVSVENLDNIHQNLENVTKESDVTTANTSEQGTLPPDSIETKNSDDIGVADKDGIATSPFLREFQEQEDGAASSTEKPETALENEDSSTMKSDTGPNQLGPEIKSDVENLVDKYFGSLYKNYEHSRKCLVRQARDVLVCEYHGCLQKFEGEFCVQAEKLLQHIKYGHSCDSSIPTGWPLCLGKSGIAVHLGLLDKSNVRNRDCYLCVRNRSTPGLEVTLFWRQQQQLHSHTIAQFRDPSQSLDDIMCSNLRSIADLEITSYDDYDGTDLPEMLQNLLVSVEHAIKRVPLDDLTFPCPQCHQYVPLERQEDDVMSCSCQCSCRLAENQVLKKDSSIQTSPMFEFVGSIPHIDSDEDDDKESIKSGILNKKLEVARPKRISELPDKLLMSGINLPGTADVDGRPIILCYAECISRAGLNKYEIAKLLLYYFSIPTPNSREKGFTILLLAENEADYKVVELLDKAVCLVGNSTFINKFLIWTPGPKGIKEVKKLTSQSRVILLSDEASLTTYITKDQAPASCGGTCTHDQLEWVEFFKQLESFLIECKTAGKTLFTTLSLLRNEEVPNQVTRRFLNHQCRQITKALDFENVQKLQKDGKHTLTSLEERSQWLASSKDVQRGKQSASDTFHAVEKVTRRLEQLKHERMEKMKELAKFRTLQEEAEELLTWTKKIGEETLNSLMLLLRSAADAAAVKEVANDFEKFFFNAWRQIEKSNDLFEECKNITDAKGQPVKELSNNLHIQMKAFREKLEDGRERIEDSSRCFLLLESCHDILEDDGKEQDEFVKLAKHSGNEKLLQLCQNIAIPDTNLTNHNQPPDKERQDQDKSPPYSLSEISAASTPVKSQNTHIRRRSVSSLAFIYHCSHLAAGEMCNCCESDTENTVSYKLKKKYIQALQSCPCGTKDTLERKNSGTLGGIKEESVENILEKIESEHNDCNRCDSGVSTAENSVGDEILYNKKKLQRICSCQYYRENCALCSAASSSTGSNQDNTENQQDSIMEEGSDGFVKSLTDDIEEDHFSEERRKVPPISANNHLYCHSSTLDLPSDALYHNMDPKTQKTLTYIIKEMIETERDYVKSLDYVIINYIPELQREDIPQALRGQRNTVFGNVEKIFEFHSHHFLNELEECINNPLQVGQIFLKYDKRFYLYALYNKNKPKSDSLMSEYGSAFFRSKQIELADKMDLASYLLKPVQRMGKYALLLQQMMKACPASAVGSSDRVAHEMDDLKQAEEMVRFQLRHGNDLLAMDSIRECDVNLKEQGRLLRQNEFLVWEGRSGKKSLRQVFLFEDLILFSKARRFPDRKNLDLYIYKNSIKMTDIGLTAKIGESPTKFEIWFRKRKPNDTFTLQSMTEEVKKIWTEELSQLLWRQAIKNRAVRMAEMSSMGIGNKPCLDIRPSDNQISDRSISFAQLSRICFAAVPRFRNSIAGSIADSCRIVARPQSVISMSSVSSSSTSSGGSAGSAGTPIGPSSNQLGLSFETCESPKSFHKSSTLNSQCSVESGIIADMSVGSDEFSEQAPSGL